MAPRAVPVPAGWMARARQRAFRHAPGDAAAVVLRHSRIYILPTRQGLAVIVTLLTMLLASLNYALSLGFVVTFVLTGLVGAALLQTFRNLAGLEIGPVSAGETFAGSPVAFTVSLQGHGSERSALSVRAAGADTVAVDVAPDGRDVATLHVVAGRRGRVPLGRLTISSHYPLGLWRGWAYVHFPLSGLAFPAPETGAPPLPAAASGNRPGRGGGGDDADLAGLREYRAGDPLQRVAWKAVARGAGWFTKEFEDAGDGGALVLDWALLPPQLGTEAKLSRLCAWVLACERATRPYALRIPGATLPAGIGREHRRAALCALALHDEVAP